MTSPAYVQVPLGCGSGAGCLRIEPIDLALNAWRYVEAYGSSEYAFLLDSADTQSVLGRFTFVGGDPFAVYTAERDRTTRTTALDPSLRQAEIKEVHLRGCDALPLNKATSSTRRAPLFTDLRAFWDRWQVRLPDRRQQPVPFVAGAVGYIGYEAVHFIESLPDTPCDDLGVPQLCLLLVDALLAHDQRRGHSYVCAVGRGHDPGEANLHARNAAERVRTRITRFEDTRNALRSGAAPGGRHEPRDEPTKTTAGVVSTVADAQAERRPSLRVEGYVDERAYAALVRGVQEQILAGNAYEVCLTHRLQAQFPGKPWRLYQYLRELNPAPFASYLQLPWGHVISASPERFLCLDARGVAECRPMKGTRRRSQDPLEDVRRRRELARSVKDRAENAMIVDLVRNDLGRVCKVGSVHVHQLMQTETYATVHQLVSSVRGSLAEGVSQAALIRACFPGGSMTGAPKIAAMKLIASLEPYCRGVYAGALGYLDFGGAMDLSMVIRTIVLKDGRCTFSVGGAVVADSDPIGEYKESMDKASALVSALHQATWDNAGE